MHGAGPSGNISLVAVGERENRLPLRPSPTETAVFRVVIVQFTVRGRRGVPRGSLEMPYRASNGSR